MAKDVRRAAVRVTGPTRGPVALTGTPGTGKSSVARRLARQIRVIEVDALARRHGAARGSGRATVVDLDRLSRAVRRPGSLDDIDLVVGHLAHLLPLREAIVLRCRPVELVARLRKARRGSAADRQANLVCEATDVVLSEAFRQQRTVFEIDTTGETVSAVARRVLDRLRTGGPSKVGTVDWLSDPAVTRLLLGRAG